MPKSNPQQKSTPDACICHQQVGAERREVGSIAQGKDRAQMPWGQSEGANSNLICGTAR